jgi:hypothetical protein
MRADPREVSAFMADDQVEFNCPHCDQLYKLTTSQLRRYAGRQTNCRKCQQPFEFPAAPEPEPRETDLEQYVPEAPAPPQPPPQPPQPPQRYEPEPAYEAEAVAQPVAPPYDAAAAPVWQPPPPANVPLSYRTPRAGRAGPSVMDFLLFREMITPYVVPVLFWLGFLYTVYGGVMTTYNAINYQVSPAAAQNARAYGYNPQRYPGGYTGVYPGSYPGSGPFTSPPGTKEFRNEMIVAGIAQTILGPIFLRITFELLIVGFRILATLRATKALLEERRP